MIARIVAAGLFGALLFTFAVPAKSDPRGDGIHTEAWFNNASFLDLKDDLAEAAKAGKGFVLIWEQPGCATCQQLHDVNFREKRLVDWIKANYAVMTMNMFGEVEVTDFDGEKLAEKALAEKHKVHFTPTTIFFDEQGKEVFRLPGYFKPYFYLAGFVFTRDKGYADAEVRGMFPRWLQAKGAKVKDIFGAPPEG